MSTPSTTATTSRHPWWAPATAPDQIRTPHPWLTPWQAYALLAVLWAATGGYILVLAWKGITIPLDITSSGVIFLGLVGVGMLSTRAGHPGFDTLGFSPRWPQDTDDPQRWRRQAWAVFGYAIVALLAGEAVYAALHLLAPEPLAPTPVIADFILRTPFVYAVTVAAVVALLSAARRPAWEMYLVSALTTAGMFVVPFGAGAIAAAVPALVMTGLFRRTRRLTPLVLAEAPAMGVAAGLTLVITHLVG